MSQPTRNVLVIVGVVVVLIAGVWWSEASNGAPAGRLIVAGDIRSDIRTVSAPAISYPTPDYAVGIPTSATAGGSSASAKHGGSSAGAPTGMPVVSGTLKRVYVREGDQVKAGQVVAQLDPTMLLLGVAQAKTAAEKDRAQVRVLGKSLDKLATATNKLASARGKLASAATKLSTAKAGLLKAQAALLLARTKLLAKQKQLLDAKAHRAQLQAQLNGLLAQAATFPPGHVPPALQQQIGALQGLLASIDPGLAGVAVGLKTIATNLAKVQAGLAALPKAAAALAKAKGQIASGASQLAKAKTQLRNAKDVLGIVAKGQDVGVALAEAKLGSATIYAPVTGAVTFARRPGTVAMVGAPIVRIAPAGPQRVDTYLTADQLATVGVGSEAEVTLDSRKGQVFKGHISEIGANYVFPPTSFPTQVVHMTTAVRVTIQLDEGANLPPGTPVDISIHTNTK